MSRAIPSKFCLLLEEEVRAAALALREVEATWANKKRDAATNKRVSEAMLRALNLSLKALWHAGEPDAVFVLVRAADLDRGQAEVADEAGA